MELSKNQRIALRKQDSGYKDQHIRKIEKFSDKFNTIFLFFLQSYRKNLLIFAGSSVDIEFDKNSYSCRECFRRFDDGQFKTSDITTRHPNIVQGVIMAKKSWGLHLKMWVDGIVEGSFRKSEILSIFEDNKIIIPEQFMVEFENLVNNKRVEYYKFEK